MRRRLRTPHGDARIELESPQLVAIHADTELAAYVAQGYAAGALRWWQLELTRRVAAGELAALLGPGAIATDRFHRDLGLRALARRDVARDAGTVQAAHVRAYVDGIDLALDDALIPAVELALLGHAPRRFTCEDVYLIAQLKYFINSPWPFELLHTLIAGALGPRRSAQLFATFTEEGGTIDPLPREADGALARDAAAALTAGLAGLAQLGLDSPDLGSNAIAIPGARTATGAPLLAADPHMGHVNPGYNLMCKLITGDGLAIAGSHFPGAPGIVVGRNRDCGWGMVGIMADNQDLIWGQLDGDGDGDADADGDGTHVRIGGAWVPLARTASTIVVRGGAPVPHVARGTADARLVCARGRGALFLRWPALDRGIGGVSLGELARATDWPSFRRGLARMTNAPMFVVYADRRGHVGYQACGLVPRRARPLGSLVQSFDEPGHRWDGYHDFDELPSALDPPGDVIAYANQYSAAVLGRGPHLANRWHPPTRAHRIAELIARTPRHDVASACAIQDDRVDGFARDRAGWLIALVPEAAAALGGWDGDTRDTARALLFERWSLALVEELLRGVLPRALADRYADLWPGHRWNILAILRDDPAAWGIDDVAAFVRRAYTRAAAVRDRPVVELRHTLRRHPLGRLAFTPRHPYDGGSRETIHVARRNTDFLTASQAGRAERAAYHFGPAFKLVYDFSPAATMHYLTATPARGTPFAAAIARELRRWRRGRRYVTRL